MKFKLVTLVLFVITTEFLFNQINTFYKSYPSTGSSGNPAAPRVNVLQINNGFVFYCPTEFKFSFLNQDGYLEQIKEYDQFTSRTLKLIKTFDGGYAAVGNSLIDTNVVVFIKFDQNLDTSWTRTYPKNTQKEEMQDIIQLPDSTYIASSGDYQQRLYVIRKITNNGTLIWNKAIAGTPTFFYYSNLLNLKNGDFLLWKPTSLIKMDSEGDTLWEKSASGSFFSYLTSDNHILYTTRTTIEKIDLNGNFIWQKPLNNINYLTEDSFGNYIYVKKRVTLYPGSSSAYGILDNAGNQVTQTEIPDDATNVISCSDGGFVISGKLEYIFSNLPIFIIKTDENLNYSAINLRSPIDSQTLNIFSTYDIIWNSNNVNNVNLDYSTDNQLTWNPIIHFYPVEEDTFPWTIPDIPAGNLYIKISDSFNPDVYDRSDPPQKTTYYQMFDYISANEIFMWLGNNGSNSHYPDPDGSGFFWPGGEEATIAAIFADGLVWGGKVNGEIRVNGDTYRYGLNSGYIQPNGLPSDPMDTKAKIFKLKRNWQSMPPSAERDRYEFDFLNWPVDVGAPWNDNNDDGIYTLGIDEPKIIGDETLFFVANDLDTIRSLYTYGSLPIGLELQVTTFGYNSELLKDVVFKKFRVINKSSADITDMYFTYWADDDLGFAGDDLSCFDSTYNIAYVYNFDNDDEFYYGTPPPAVAHMIVQGPIIPATSSDSARFDDRWRKGFKNLEMTSSGLIVEHSQYPTDVPFGVYEGTLQFYNQMQGLNNDGSYIIDPTTNLPTIWPLTGDPVTGTGWYQIDYYPMGGDQRYHLPSGPFNLAIGDTQEVVIAFLIKKGTDNLNSITELRNYAAQIQHWYDNDFVTDVDENNILLPTEFSLSQNYPNPFNPSTTISYQLPVTSNVTLKIYDILGSEVATLVNQEQSVGNYKVDFNASHLSSGIYFYQVKAGSFVQTKKMILIK
jgi:hypothetical protein